MDNINNLRAVILAAGKGTRMKSSTPKVLHKIFGLTLIERVINQVLRVEGIDKIFVVIGHGADMVQECLDKSYDKEKIKTVLQTEQKGTADAVFRAYNDLENFDGNVLILCGDTPLLDEKTLSDFLEYHNSKQADLTVMSALLDNPAGYGRIIRKQDKSLEKIVEQKDASDEQKTVNEVNAGVYCFRWKKIKQAFFEISTNNSQGEYYLTDVIEWAVKQGLNTQAYILENSQKMLGINSKEQLSEAFKILNEEKLNELHEKGITIYDDKSTFISPETEIEEDTIIYPNVYIEGTNHFGKYNIIGPNTTIYGNVTTDDNVKITQSQVSDLHAGKNTTIGPFSHIRDGVKLAEKVRVGNFVEVKKSTIESHTNCAHLSYIGDAAIGSDVNIGAGTITANYNAITKEKSKTILKNGVKVGSNSVLVAPVTVEENANIAAGTIVTENIPSEALAITRSHLRIIADWVIEKKRLFLKK